MPSITVSATSNQTVMINLEVPSGPGRTFTAEAKDSDGLILFQGQSETPVDLSPGVPTTVDITDTVEAQRNSIFVNADTGIRYG